MRRRPGLRQPILTAAALALATVLVAAGCSGSTPEEDAGGGAGGGRGPFTMAGAKDTTGKLQTLLDKWNQAHPDEKVTYVELPSAADAQRTAMAQDFQAHAGRYDILVADVVWMAEFAERGWIEPLDDLGMDTSKLVHSAVETATWDGKLYGAPYTSGTALLYYRKDLVPTPPETWEELVAACAVAKREGIGCYAGQFAQYEGLTVNFSEAVNSAGGSILSEDGSEVTVDSPEAREGLEFLVNGFEQGYIPKEAITYQEEEGRRAFQQGRLLFLRNWTYVYNLAKTPGKDSVVQDKFDVAPLPGMDGPGASTLGGSNLTLNADSKHKASAVDFMKFMQTEEAQRSVLLDLSGQPVLASIYDDPELQKQVPYLGILKESIEAAKPRPKTPNYNAVTLAVAKHAHAALQGNVPPDQALSDMKAELEEAVQAR